MTEGSNKVKMIHALKMMTAENANQSRYKINGKTYEYLKREYSKVRSQFNIEWTEDRREKYRLSIAAIALTGKKRKRPTPGLKRNRKSKS